MVRYCEKSKSKVKTSKLILLASSVCYIFQSVSSNCGKDCEPRAKVQTFLQFPEAVCFSWFQLISAFPRRSQDLHQRMPRRGSGDLGDLGELGAPRAPRGRPGAPATPSQSALWQRNRPWCVLQPEADRHRHGEFRCKKKGPLAVL